MSPIEETLARLGPAAERLSVRAAPGRRRVPASRLARPGTELVRTVEGFGRALGTGEISVAASLYAQAWAVSVTRATIACLVLERRVPDVSAGNSDLLLDDIGRPVGVVLGAARFATLAGDPAAGHPSARTVPDAAALFAWARRQVLGRHLAQMVESLKGIAPIGGRLLWGNVAAAAAGGFAVLSTGGVEPARLLAEAAEFLDAPGTPTAGLAGLFPVEHAGSTRLFVKRDTCCLVYRLPDAPAKCLSCRLLDDEERRRGIRLRLEATG